MEKVTVYGRSAGMPVCVAAWRDGHEYGCVVCYKRFNTDSEYVAHAAQYHYQIVAGGNAPRDAGV